MLSAIVTGCATQESGSDYGATHTRRLQQSPEAAAHCFARNAEEHSSALVAQVTPARDGGARVLVQVKNGVAYATADIKRAGAASVAAITLMVRASGGQNDLLDALVKGC